MDVSTTGNETVNILSFLAVALCMALGAYWHYRSMVGSGRHAGTLWDYLIADHPQRSMSVGLVILGAAWTAAYHGSADNLNPELVWALIKSGNLHGPTIETFLEFVLIGRGIDSAINKGSEQ